MKPISLTAEFKRRELLDSAAKAAIDAGLDLFWHHANQCYMIVEGSSERKWNPQLPDDSLVLAVLLGLAVEINLKSGSTKCCLVGSFFSCTVPHNGVAIGATCYAILRTAAALGRGLE